MASRSIETFNSPGNAARRPPSILLDQLGHFDNSTDITDNNNETTATAESMGGHTMAVTFWIADPPETSFFSVVCSKPPGFRVYPHVVGAEGRFVLLHSRVFVHKNQDEYFMYKADDAESPSLERVPLPDTDGGLRGVREFGVVPRGHGGHYLLATLSEVHDASLDYKLHIYSSESKTCCSRILPNPCTEVKKIIPQKVITIGEGVLGWVDFSCGMLVCNLSQEPPDAHFVPLPKPLPENRYKIKVPPSESSPRLFRDVTCVDGVLKFVEMEHRVTEIAPEQPSDPSDTALLYDSDMITWLKMDEKPKQPRSRYGWRAVTWTRPVLSSNYWRKGCTVDVADILVDESTHSSLLSGIRGKSSEELTFWDLYSAFPILSTDGDNIIYLKSTVEPSDQNGWVVAVDLGNKTMKELGACSFEYHDPCEQAFRPCTLSHHLNMTPGTVVQSSVYKQSDYALLPHHYERVKVSAYCKITQVGSSANNPNNTSVHVDKANSCDSRNKLQRISAEKDNHARNEAQIIAQNDRISGSRRLCPGDDDNVESTLKLRRLILSGKYTHPRNVNQSIVQNDTSWVPPVQNNLAPQQSFNKWDWPYQPGCSSWPHQNNLCLNNPDGPCDPGYAPMGPAPNLHEYGNCQPQWQHPPSSQQQLQPIRHFGPHEVARPCFNNWDGSSYHGSQQLPSCDSYAYGTHTDYGNYQQQWQQRPPIQELPASASWQQPPPRPHGGVWIS